jgi:hypothetical protein
MSSPTSAATSESIKSFHNIVRTGRRERSLSSRLSSFYPKYSSDGWRGEKEG